MHSSYPLFVPPSLLLSKPKARYWSREDAKIYFDWLMSVADGRVAFLLEHIDLAGPVEVRGEGDFLHEAGRRAVALLQSSQYSVDTGARPSVTGQGAAP